MICWFIKKNNGGVKNDARQEKTNKVSNWNTTFDFMNLIQDNWSLPRIILLAVSLIVLIISTISTIIKIQKE